MSRKNTLHLYGTYVKEYIKPPYIMYFIAISICRCCLLYTYDGFINRTAVIGITSAFLTLPFIFAFIKCKKSQ